MYLHMFLLIVIVLMIYFNWFVLKIMPFVLPLFMLDWIGLLPKLTFYGNRLRWEWQNWTEARCARASGAGRRQGAQTVLRLTSKSFCLGPVPV